jgi:hypothetical protein
MLAAQNRPPSIVTHAVDTPRDPDRPKLSAETMQALRAALAHRTRGDAIIGEMKAALDRVCEESHALSLDPEDIVVALRSTWALVRRPYGVGAHEWEVEYLRVVGQCLSVFFGEEAG